MPLASLLPDCSRPCACCAAAAAALPPLLCCAWLRGQGAPLPCPLPQSRFVPCSALQEWNEIQFNGVHYEPPEVGRPGVLEADKSYTFKYPRPPK